MTTLLPGITSKASDGTFGYVADVGDPRQGQGGWRGPDGRISCTAAASFDQGKLASATKPCFQNACGQCKGLPSAQPEGSLSMLEATVEAGTAAVESEPRHAAIYETTSLYSDPVRRKPRELGNHHGGVLLKEFRGTVPKLADIFGMPACQEETRATGATVGAAEATSPARGQQGYVVGQLQGECDSQPSGSDDEAAPTLTDAFGPLSEDGGLMDKQLP
eukprot:CAMPEP_0172814742 /NCGR_PEP_ID=MMETSP1075-20121228/11389_1 /TAXON_ID=2916 /ORGANISM="Ceratium fusus, Strain PA161109" /LENGTH=218 /DNA_ID=CAMNT_0013654547 /DNA_START=66 /DNA_END=722 /DNA_ORIENTATION=+